MSFDVEYWRLQRDFHEDYRVGTVHIDLVPQEDAITVNGMLYEVARGDTIEDVLDTVSEHRQLWKFVETWSREYMRSVQRRGESVLVRDIWGGEHRFTIEPDFLLTVRGRETEVVGKDFTVSVPSARSGSWSGRGSGLVISSVVWGTRKKPIVYLSVK